MIRPVDAPVSQRFGENPTKHLPWDSWLIKTFGNYQPDGHSGQDYACDVGSPIRAVTDGVVLHIGFMGGSYLDNPWWIMPSFAGYVAVIDHGSFIGIYGHCKDGSAKVRKGDRVREGQVFVLSGNTGASTGPHLHFEILPDKYNLHGTMYGRTNPETLFTGLSYAGSIISELKELGMDAEQEKRVIAAINGTGDRVINDLRAHVRAGAADTAKELKTVPGAVWSYRNPELGNADAFQILRDAVAGTERLAGDVAAVAARAASNGASVEQITEAVKKALSESVVNVDVRVQGKP